MDIGWAVEHLREGHKVRRGHWLAMQEPYEKLVGGTAWDYVYIEWREGHAPTVMVRRGDGQSCHFGMIDDHLLAEDWEAA